MGWLRGGELFGLRWKDVEVVPPSMDPPHNLPPGSGALLFTLLDATKSSQTKTADHIVAFKSASGLQPGKAFLDLLASRPGAVSATSPIFCHSDGRTWTSSHFRQTYLYPYLEQQLREGDATLKTWTQGDPARLSEKVYSLHTYRRGGRTHVERKRIGCVRRATASEIEEHGRWRTRNTRGTSMSTHYHEPSLEDRIYITLLCM